MEVALLNPSAESDRVVDPTVPPLPPILGSAGPDTAAPACAVELIGSFQGSGRTDDTYLAKRSDGQWVQLSPLLWLTLSNLDGIRSSTQVADCVTAAWGQPVAGEDIDYLIEKKLLPTGLVGTTASPLERPDLILALRVKKVLVPGRVVSAISRPLRFLFWSPIVLIVTGLFLGAETYAFTSGRLIAGLREAVGHPGSLLLVLGLVVSSIFVHEMGHASGCRYGGATPGDLGVGIYVSAPAFFTDLTDGYRLGRSGRVRGDLGGVYFNAVFAVVVFPFYLITGSTLLLLVIAAMVIEILEQMMPFVRSDGYWAVSDVAGVPDLYAYMGSAFRRGKGSGSQVAQLSTSSRRLVMAWSAVTMIALPLGIAFFFFALPTLLVSSWRSIFNHVSVLSHGGGAATIAAALVGIVFTFVIMVAMTYGAVYLTRRFVQMAANASSGPAHSTQRTWQIRRLARVSLVICALAIPVAWSAAHIRIH
jgi:putative peptide zinc metalloprotease protein